MTGAAPYPTEFPDRETAFSSAATFAMARLRVRPIGAVEFEILAEHNTVMISIVGELEYPGGERGVFGSSRRSDPIFPGGAPEAVGEFFGTTIGIEIPEADFAAAVERLAKDISDLAEWSASVRSPRERPIPPETPYSFSFR